MFWAQALVFFRRLLVLALGFGDPETWSLGVLSCCEKRPRQKNADCNHVHDLIIARAKNAAEQPDHVGERLVGGLRIVARPFVAHKGVLGGI